MKRLLAIRDEVMAALAPVGCEELDRDAAAGRFLAEDARAVLGAPPYDCSAMDGYAVRAAELVGPVALPIRGAIYAGDPAPPPLGPGETVRIFTGGPIPPGVDAVVREEAVRREGDLARFTGPVRTGDHLRRAGEDVPAGGLALEAGTRLGPRQVALLAAVGRTHVAVRRRLRVALVATGDEVVSGRLVDSNGPAVAGLLRGLGADVVSVAVGDRLEDVAGAVAACLESCDAVVTTGGVSVGERDHVPEALRLIGAEVRVHGVPMKPGKPFLFALRAGKPVFGLPGSPSACLVAFEVFVRPALLALAGAARRQRLEVSLPLAEAAWGRPGRARLLWATVEADGRVRALGRDAAQIRGPALANALVLLPSDTGDLPEGAPVRVWILGEDLG